MIRYILLTLTVALLSGCDNNRSNTSPRTQPGVGSNAPAGTLSGAPPVSSSETNQIAEMSGSSGTRGGGDTSVVEFYRYGEQINDWMTGHYSLFEKGDAQKFSAMFEKLKGLANEEKKGTG